jgi:hypothetical protein
LPRIARHLFQHLNDDFSKAVRCIPSHIGHASRPTPLQLTACTCAGLVLFGYLPDPARAQLVANCQTTSAPSLFPFIADESPNDELNGWAADTDSPTAHATFAVGDIDGDGNDELVSLPAYTDLSQQRAGQVKVTVSRWIQTGWTPMASITNAMLINNLNISGPQNSTLFQTNFSGYEFHLADVDGDGQKEVVVHLMGLLTFQSNVSVIPGVSTPIPTPIPFDQEQIYHYNTATKAWTFVTSYAAGGTSAKWIKVNTTDKQQVRITLDNSGSKPRLNAATWANGKWNTAPYSPIMIQNEKFATGCAHGMGLKGYCVAFGDVTGDGLTDLVYVGAATNIHYLIPSIPGSPFGSNEVSGQLQIHQSDEFTNWQLGDIDGSGVSGLLIAGGDVGFGAFYWNSSSNIFVSVADPNVELAQTAEVLGPFSSLEIVPKPIVTTNYDQNGNSLPSGPSMGVAAIGKSGTYLLKFTNSGGQHTFPGVYDFSNVPNLTSTISANAGVAPAAYSGYFRFATEGQNVIMLARSASGIVNLVPSGTAYVDPNTLTDRGYPAYTKSQQAAYQYIGATAAGNSDIRALYSDPAVPWSYVQYQVETLAAPPASSGISAADFQLVQKQTIDELTALQSVNLFYGVTGQILTNTYLVKDAALSEVTDALSLASNPDVTSQTINILTSVLGGIGGLVGTAGSILQLAGDAAKVADIVNRINAASYVVSLMSTVTGDIATYSPGSSPGDTATGTFALKTVLDNAELGAATANACHQLESLSAWNQSRPIADGILTEAIPLDLQTQQDILQAGQAIYRMDVWQTLVPTKYDYYAIWGNGVGCKNCAFPGNSSYPLADSVQATATCDGGLNYLSPSGIYTLVLGDPQTHNWPNINALNALFNLPPQGLGVSPSDVFFGKNGWSISYGGFDTKFESNINGFSLSYRVDSCSNFQPLVPQVTPSVRAGAITSSVMSRDVVDASRGLAGPRLEELVAHVKSNLTDAQLRDRLVMFLDAANTRLRQARQHNSRPTETLRLLNLFIAQSQWHTRQSFRDSQTSQAESIEAVGIRDSLLSAGEERLAKN